MMYYCVFIIDITVASGWSQGRGERLFLDRSWKLGTDSHWSESSV